MTGVDWLLVAAVLALIAALIAADRAYDRRKRQAEAPCDCWWCTQTRQHRRNRELESQG